ncbi:acetylcholinesterase-1-like [Ixodes scapularis]|uniref:acetylcholinesterase-1-like n=1 Tax=Ixodes scapularis TaxID=6945 RepID=UPI001A9DBD45|nr:acetylcholinesterase-1-like [Ixodes scapularis]
MHYKHKVVTFSDLHSFNRQEDFILMYVSYVKRIANCWYVLCRCCLIATMITLITLIVPFVALMTVFRSLSSQNCFQVALVIGDVIGTAMNFQNAGSTHHTIAFLGVPFAENTGGEKRFGKPEAKKRWQTVFNATYKRSPCCQELTSGKELFRASLSDTTEDCLHLNIWVPTDCMEGIQRYPVVFWVYGGGFEYGGNNYDIYDGRYMSGFGNLVVVVPNYRINAFGFLNVETQDVPGNMGFHDVILAYRWVLDHIGRFGGDRENIVLAGQSAGSIIAGLLMMSPILPPSFFSKAYLMSGSVFMKLQENSNETALENFNKLANEANCSMTTTTETLL